MSWEEIKREFDGQFEFLPAETWKQTLKNFVRHAIEVAFRETTPEIKDRACRCSCVEMCDCQLDEGFDNCVDKTTRLQSQWLKEE